MASSLEQMRRLAEDVVATYVSRLETVSQIIEEAYDLLSRGRLEREKLSGTLRDLLAESNSLRRKDFNQMVGDIFKRQNEREDVVKGYMKKFLRQQAELAKRLEEALREGDLEMVGPIQASIERGMTKAKQLLSDFHHEEQMFMRRLKALVDKGDGLTVAEFKTAVTQMRSDLSVWTEPALVS